MKRKKDTDTFIKNAKADRASNTLETSDLKLKRLVVDLPENLHRELKIMSAREDKKMRFIIAEMIEERSKRYK